MKIEIPSNPTNFITTRNQLGLKVENIAITSFIFFYFTRMCAYLSVRAFAHRGQKISLDLLELKLQLSAALWGLGTL